eukprot:SAG31_NODE_515_length_14710_cov_6.289097_2_plen_173_part_00
MPGEPAPEPMCRPAFIDRRIELFEEFKALADQRIAGKERKQIKVIFKTEEGEKEAIVTAWDTNVFQAAKAAGVHKKVINSGLLARVHDMNGEPMGVAGEGQWDMERPLVDDCMVEILDWNTDLGKASFWHSSAHVLGHAMEVSGCLLLVLLVLLLRCGFGGCGCLQMSGCAH